MSEKSDAKRAQEKATDKAHDKSVQEKPKRPVMQAMKPIVSASGKEVKGIVRIAGKDLRGNFTLKRAIISVKGVGLNLGGVLSHIITGQLGLNEKTMVGELSEEEVEKFEKILMRPQDFGVPIRMLNRQKDIFTGTDSHYIGTDLVYMVKQDIEHEKDSNTWRGYRHAYGQKVRGQRTRTGGRTGMTVGVLRKSVLAKAGAAATAQTGAVAQAAGAAAPAAGAKGAAAPKAGSAAVKAATGGAPAAKATPAKKEEAKK